MTGTTVEPDELTGSAHAAQLRQAIVDRLDGGGLKARKYLGEAATPKSAVVGPGDPYIERPTAGSGMPFGQQRVRVDVLLVGPLVSAKGADREIDKLIDQALDLLDGDPDTDLDPFGVTTVSGPGPVQLPRSGPTYMAAVITIEDTTEA